MTVAKPAMKMPELLVFAKSLAIGFVGTEVWHVAFYLSESFALSIFYVPLWEKTIGIVSVLLLCLIYLINRNAFRTAARIGRSLRLDLLIAIGIGIWTNKLASLWLVNLHEPLKSVDPRFAPTLLVLFCSIFLSPLLQILFQNFSSRTKPPSPQRYFITDNEISDENEDLLASKSQAKSFAEAVLDSGSHPGLVFGVDGPWGVGKTSFINLAQHYWKQAEDRVIVCRFEPLRYASEPDLADRLIRDVTTAIQKTVFVPELRPAASRYSRLIKGKADVSFLGFKISLEPSQESIDDLLDDIDNVLKNISKRVIIVIDDLDRLDPKTINNVLFSTRRTFKLSQANYVLCYDTEVIAGNQDEGSRAREFLEKFVTIKFNLFIDSSNLRDFLRRDWKKIENQLSSIPSDTMQKLSEIFTELADILDGDLAANYLPIVGDLRKLKRFINTLLLMQMERTDFGRTDFNKRDLINLIFLHLNYPGLFRKIYAEETEGRSGVFSIRNEFGKEEFINTNEFKELLKEENQVATFLLKQLFDVTTLELGSSSEIQEETLRSRACFNGKCLPKVNCSIHNTRTPSNIYPVSKGSQTSSKWRIN
ncbi:KAP family NTPase [Aeromonas bestiarum]|uniref:KAP family NTPase n=1 Tax=Aeromonas bestiarum TaxID=105751 RepID=A0AAW7IB97_9GAMM|nr:KAP family NTPase [Aeromonas bestiarum]MDM5141122.1 KAP family NTPase [Aeromonas bestiarum]